MARVASPLTIEDYESLYGHQSGWEYRAGRVYRKPVPTFLHGLLAIILGDLLRLAGYVTSVEADVRLTEDWSPRPDICGVLKILADKYPRSVDVVCEIRSENEDILAKCREYGATGAVGQIFVFDIQTRTIQTWNGTDLVPISDVTLKNGVTITGRRIWRELEERQKSSPPTAMILD